MSDWYDYNILLIFLIVSMIMLLLCCCYDYVVIMFNCSFFFSDPSERSRVEGVQEVVQE